MARKKKDPPAPAPEPPAGPDPSARAVGSPRGVPAVLGDGKEWVLARLGLARGADGSIAAARNRLYERLLVDREADAPDILLCAWSALRLNYDLSDEELTALVVSTDPSAIVDAVAEAAIPSLYEGDRGYDDWARSALLSNGLRPSEVPADDLPHVLAQLVGTGRAVPLNRFTEAGRHAALRDELRGMIARQEAERRAIRATE